jgi:hypothetical protein
MAADDVATDGLAEGWKLAIGRSLSTIVGRRLSTRGTSTLYYKGSVLFV